MRAPATQAFNIEATQPETNALNTTCAKSFFLSGAKAPRPPSWIPMEPGLAKPQSANVAMVAALSLICPASCRIANS